MLDRAKWCVRESGYQVNSNQKVSHSATKCVLKKSDVTGDGAISTSMVTLNLNQYSVNNIDELDGDNNATTNLPWHANLENTNTVKKLLKNTNGIIKCGLDQIGYVQYTLLVISSSR